MGQHISMVACVVGRHKIQGRRPCKQDKSTGRDEKKRLSVTYLGRHMLACNQEKIYKGRKITTRVIMVINTRHIQGGRLVTRKKVERETRYCLFN